MVEWIPKKEFYALHVSPSLKKEVRSSAICLYVCAVITAVFYSLVMETAIPWIDMLIVIGCGLGLQFGKSRACAVIITRYGVRNTLFWLIDTGKYGGWWIIAIGVAAIKGSFALHKEYVRFLREGTLPLESPPIIPEPTSGTDGTQQTPVIVGHNTTPVYKPGAILASAAPFAMLFPAFFLTLAVISDPMLEWLVGRDIGALPLLQGYRQQYILCIVALAAGVLLAVAGCVVSLIWGTRTRGAIALMIVCVIAAPLFPGAMILVEEIPTLITRAQEDIDQIYWGRSELATVWLSPKTRSVRLPGPSGAEPVTRHGGIGTDTNNK